MNKTTKKNIAVITVLAIMAAGIFCYQGIQQTMESHCSTGTSVWCSGVLEHGSIISDTILATFLTISSLTIIFVVLSFIFKRDVYLNIIKHRMLPSNATTDIPVIPSINVAMSRGIIHSKVF